MSVKIMVVCTFSDLTISSAFIGTESMSSEQNYSILIEINDFTSSKLQVGVKLNYESRLI